ncbi:MAG: LuxR C-terminal-related transcriptional regulator [Nitrospira sp.]
MPKTQAQPRTVAIITGQYVVWLGLKKMLESSPDIRIIGQPYQRLDSSLFLNDNQPDVIILDTETERDIISHIQQIRGSSPSSKIMALGGFQDNDRMREAVEHGADGVILKIHPPAVVLAAIESLHPSHHHNDSVGENEPAGVHVEDSIPGQYEPTAQTPGWPDALTEREREVITLVGRGLSNKDIAYHLSISDSTVRHHLTSIFDKVGVPNRQKLLLHTHHFRFPAG